MHVSRPSGEDVIDLDEARLRRAVDHLREAVRRLRCEVEAVDTRPTLRVIEGGASGVRRGVRGR